MSKTTLAEIKKIITTAEARIKQIETDAQSKIRKAIDDPIGWVRNLQPSLSMPTVSKDRKPESLIKNLKPISLNPIMTESQKRSEASRKAAITKRLNKQYALSHAALSEDKCGTKKPSNPKPKKKK